MVEGDYLYAFGDDGRVRRIDRASGDTLPPKGLALPDSVPMNGFPAVHDGKLYVASETQGTLFVIDTATGDRLATAEGHFGVGGMAIAGDVLYRVEGNQLIAAEIPSLGLLWKLAVPGLISGSPCSPPTIAGGFIVVATNGVVVAITGEP